MSAAGSAAPAIATLSHSRSNAIMVGIAHLRCRVMAMPSKDLPSGRKFSSTISEIPRPHMVVYPPCSRPCPPGFKVSSSKREANHVWLEIKPPLFLYNRLFPSLRADHAGTDGNEPECPKLKILSPPVGCPRPERAAGSCRIHPNGINCWAPRPSGSWSV